LVGAFAQNPDCQTSVYPFSWQNGITKLIAYDSSSAAVQGYLWSNGATTQSIEVNDYATYCCTVTYTNGCTASDCYDLGQPCSSYASWWPSNQIGSYELQAFAYPYYLSPGATYLWDNGATTRTTTVSGPGTYCVTITMPTGCTSTACAEITNTVDCEFGWSYSYSTGGGGIELEAVPYTPGNYTYLWNTGQTTSEITIISNGLYCCTVTEASGACQKSRCYTINSIDCPPVVISQNGNKLKATAIDTTSIPLSYLWSTGATTQEITTTPSPLAQQYSVTVTFSTGCTTVASISIPPASTCTASITYNADNTLTAQPGGGTAPYTYLWTPGNFTTPTIAPTVEDYYSVEITDANGCKAWTGLYWYSANQCSVNIFIQQDSFPGAGQWLYASTFGDPNAWMYTWNNGSTGNFIYATAAGEYCVTATNVLSGCTATSCFWLQPGGACAASISGEQVDLSTWELSAAGSPAAISTYAWSNGASTPDITVNQPGYYAVTLTNADGCTVSAYYYLRPLKELLVSVNLSGDTSSNPSPGNGVHARLYLIRYDTAQGGTLTAVDTTDTYSWNDWWALGAFKNVVPGYYLIKAALLPGSTGYADYLPTYYQSSLLWSDGTTFEHSSMSPYNSYEQANIVLVKGQNPGGPGFVGGLVSEGANFSGGQSDRAEGDPLPGVSIVLTLPDGTPMGHATTDAQGQYSFPNLPWGTYVLTI
ncbi:MAG TPA: carboxypeptidase-like regulatory domain-containing protein, partial [Saprospiraceae bacterium]|nr:carboxypeptidase-like regulatory domain-containing protein [Saprospiraceae bacterium]